MLDFGRTGGIQRNRQANSHEASSKLDACRSPEKRRASGPASPRHHRACTLTGLGHGGALVPQGNSVDRQKLWQQSQTRLGSCCSNRTASLGGGKETHRSTPTDALRLHRTNPCPGLSELRLGGTIFLHRGILLLFGSQSVPLSRSGAKIRRGFGP